MAKTVFACVGTVSKDEYLVIKGLKANEPMRLPVGQLKAAWKGPFEELI